MNLSKVMMLSLFAGISMAGFLSALTPEQTYQNAINAAIKAKSIPMVDAAYATAVHNANMVNIAYEKSHGGYGSADYNNSVNKYKQIRNKAYQTINPNSPQAKNAQMEAQEEAQMEAQMAPENFYPGQRAPIYLKPNPQANQKCENDCNTKYGNWDPNGFNNCTMNCGNMYNN